MHPVDENDLAFRLVRKNGVEVVEVRRISDGARLPDMDVESVARMVMSRSERTAFCTREPE